MKKKQFYFVIQISENNKYYAFISAYDSDDNIAARLKSGNVVAVNVYARKKNAVYIASHINAVHKANNNYLFEEVAQNDAEQIKSNF